MLRCIGFIFAGALLLGVFLPGTVALLTENYYASQVEQHLGSEAATKLSEFKKQQERNEKELKRIEAVLLEASQNPSQWQNLDSLLKLREHLKQETQNAPPLYVSGYYLDYTMPLWPLLYTCLGILAFILSPPRLEWRSLLRPSACVFLCIFIVQRLPTWWRNSPLGHVGRTVYSNVNIDISRVGFFTQEFMAAITCMLLAIIWCQWLANLVEHYKESGQSVEQPLSAVFDFNKLDRLSAAFAHWQLMSLVLSAGFVYYTFFFWRAVAGDGDIRYVVAALIVHALWGATWVIISLPLVFTWYNWSKIKTHALTTLGNNKDLTPDQVSNKMAILLELKPIPAWSFAGSSIGAFVAFVWPIVQAFWKH